MNTKTELIGRLNRRVHFISKVEKMLATLTTTVYDFCCLTPRREKGT